MRSTVEIILRWFARIGAAFNKPTQYFSPPRPASHITAETESATEETRVIPAANENATIQPTTGAFFPVPVSADAKSRLDPAPHIAAENRTESATEEARVIAATNESATIQPTPSASFPAPASAEAKIEPDTQVNHVPPVLPDQHEIPERGRVSIQRLDFYQAMVVVRADPERHRRRAIVDIDGAHIGRVRQ